MSTAAPIEAKKHAFRQTQDGVVISFVLHPQDVPASLAIASLGTRYALALVEITDENERALSPGQPGKEPSPEPEKERRPFHDLPRSQQAGIACSDVAFQRYMAEMTHAPVQDADSCARALRTWLAIESRRTLDDNSSKSVAWDSLYAGFLRWSGRTPEAR